MTNDDRIDLEINLLKKRIDSLEHSRDTLERQNADVNQQKIVEINLEINLLKKFLNSLERRKAILARLRAGTRKQVSRLEKSTADSNSNGTDTIEAANINRENQLHKMRWYLFGLAFAFCFFSFTTFFIWIWNNAEFLFSKDFNPLRYILLAILLFVPTFILYFISCNVFRHHETKRDREKSILDILAAIKESLKELIPFWKGK